jgi:hypothetical protein
MVTALQSVFDSGYDRDRQLQNLKVGPTYPMEEIGYPAIVIEYENTRVMNAGVGHEEWFEDDNNILRKWNHSRFEGNVNIDIVTLSPLTRDIVADALIEVLRFGRLDAALESFFDTIYGDPNDPDTALVFTQLMLNTDDISGAGNAESIAPWNPEDLHVYETSYTVEIHGGYYNVYPTDTWDFVTSVDAASYLEGWTDVTTDVPFYDPDRAWTNPFVYVDYFGVTTGVAVISSAEGEYSGIRYDDADAETGVAVVSADDLHDYNDSLKVIGEAVVTGADSDP